MKIKYGIMIAIVAYLINSAAIATSASDEIKKLSNNNDFMGACKLRIDLARTMSEEANYYTAAVCAKELPVLGVDFTEIKKWLEIGADKGHHGSFVNLAELYENARGVDGNLNTAVRYYNKAIEHSNNVKYNEKLNRKVNSLKLQISCSIRTTNLFDTLLKCSGREVLSKAIKKNGGVLLSVKPTSIIYDSSELLDGSKRLEVFFLTKGNIFSCMRYTFGLFTADVIQKQMMNALVDKYGAFEEYNGHTNNIRNTMTWILEDGIVITLKNRKINTTLEYCLPAYERIRLAEIEANSKTLLDKKAKEQSNAY